MSFKKLFIKHHSIIWVCIFSLIIGTAVTGMTGYATLGSNFSLSLLMAVGINLFLGIFVLNLKGRLGSITLYKVLTSMFRGKRGKIFNAMVGMTFLLILFMLAASESRSGAYAMSALMGYDSGSSTYTFLVCLLALIPGILGIRYLLKFSLYSFMIIVLARSLFTTFSMIFSTDIPEWSIHNLINTFDNASLSGSNGISFMSFRLAFWSLVGIEALSIWNSKGLKQFLKPKFIVLMSFLLVLSMVPGLTISGIFPTELWQLIISSDDGCYGNCAALTFGEYFGGVPGFYFMGITSTWSHVALVSISYALIFNLILQMSKQRMFFAGLSDKIYFLDDDKKEIPTNLQLLSFAIVFLLSFVNFESADWRGLSIYICFALILSVGGLSVLNFHFKWFKNQCIQTRAICRLAIVSTILLVLLFYISFKGEHSKYLTYSVITFIFSLVTALFSLTFLLRLYRKRIS